MLHFQELRITPDSKYLIIDIAVDQVDYYDKVNIGSVIIDNQDTFVQSGPSSTPIYTFTAESDYDLVYSIPEGCCNPVMTEDKSYCFVDEKKGIKQLRLYLTSKDIGNLNSNMFFVYAVATGYPSPDTPCGMDNTYIMGTVINLYPFYQATIGSLKEMNNSCEPPKNFIDSILRFKALELSVKTGNYPLAITYWKRFFSTEPRQSMPIKPCGCHGRNN